MKLSNFLTMIIIIFLIGCKNPFNPKIINKNTDEEEYSFTTPENTLKSLSLSYRNRDINLFKKCLSKKFRFELIESEVKDIGIDMNNDNIPDSWWGYQQEVNYHNNLFTGGASETSLKPPDELSLDLIIPPANSWIDDTQNEGWIIISCPFNLRLVFYDTFSSIDSSGFAYFCLKQENGSWVIAVWRDESNI